MPRTRRSVFFKGLTSLLLILSLLTFIGSSLRAQQSEEVDKKTARQLKKQQKIDEGRFMITPLAGPAYSPELGFLLAVGGMLSYKTNPSDSLIQRSSSPTVVSYTSTGAITASSMNSTYWFRDKMRIYAELKLKDMPDNYWGVGYENGRDRPESDSTTAYQRFWWKINPSVLWQFKKNYFVGLNIDLNYTQGSEESQGVLADPDYQKYNDRPFNTGIGIILQFDTRDIPTNSWKGWFVDVSATRYSKVLGGDNDYQIYQFDVRKYIKVQRQGRTLALQAKSRLGVGEVPYGEMSQLGTPVDLRGYTWGRYRDKSMLYFISEYRHMFQKRNQALSPHGVVLWAAAGSIADNALEFDNWLPNFGIGYRLEVQPRMNVRFDIGFGKETMGVYFNFNETF